MRDLEVRKVSSREKLHETITLIDRIRSNQQQHMAKLKKRMWTRIKRAYAVDAAVATRPSSRHALSFNANSHDSDLKRCGNVVRKTPRPKLGASRFSS